MIKELKQEELEVYYDTIQKLRERVLVTIQPHGYSISDLVTKKIEHDIEQELGRKILKSGYYNAD